MEGFLVLEVLSAEAEEVEAFEPRVARLYRLVEPY